MICTFELQTTHLHEHPHSLIKILVIIQYAFHLYSSRNDLTEIPDSYFISPAVIGGCCSTHDDFGMGCHQIEHRTQHIFSHILVVNINLLPTYHLPHILLKLLSRNIPILIIFFIINRILTAQILRHSAFLISTSNSIYIFISQFAQVLGDSQTYPTCYG